MIQLGTCVNNYIKKIRYIYNIIPARDQVENINTGGRWYLERTTAYLNMLLEKYNYDIEYLDNSQLSFDKELPEDVLTELKNKSPNINITYIGEVDICLDDIIYKLKEASCLALKYNAFDILDDINKIIIKAATKHYHK